MTTAHPEVYANLGLNVPKILPNVSVEVLNTILYVNNVNVRLEVPSKYQMLHWKFILGVAKDDVYVLDVRNGCVFFTSAHTHEEWEFTAFSEEIPEVRVFTYPQYDYHYRTMIGLATSILSAITPEFWNSV